MTKDKYTVAYEHEFYVTNADGQKSRCSTIDEREWNQYVSEHINAYWHEHSDIKHIKSRELIYKDESEYDTEDE